MSNNKIILGLQTSPKVTFKSKSCETSRNCFHFLMLDKLFFSFMLLWDLGFVLFKNICWTENIRNTTPCFCRHCRWLCVVISYIIWYTHKQLSVNHIVSWFDRWERKFLKSQKTQMDYVTEPRIRPRCPWCWTCRLFPRPMLSTPLAGSASEATPEPRVSALEGD